MIFQPGTPRIGLLAAGVRNATLWLPMPDAGLPQIQWIPKGSVKELVDGSEVWQQKGWIPQLTMTWSAYDDRSTEGWTLGTANGDRPAITDLMTILSGAPASFSVSPGPAAGGSTPSMGPSCSSSSTPSAAGSPRRPNISRASRCSTW